MITREQIFEIARQMPGCVIDNPFDEDYDTVVLRHGDSEKWFGIVLKGPCRKVGLDKDGETDLLNLKCDPIMSYGLFQTCPAVVPAYHMNKYHWISIIMEKELSADTLEMLIHQSFLLTGKKPRSNRKPPQNRGKSPAVQVGEPTMRDCE